ncbi:MAG: hypothetical protein ABIR84_09995 [Candidatus Nitrotoga sp.]
MNKIIVNFAIASCIALGATVAHAADTPKAATKSYNYYEMYDPHGAVQTVAGSGAQGVIHTEIPLHMDTDSGVVRPNAPIPPTRDMVDPGHSKVDGA